MALSDLEREEVAYERWLLAGGPKKATDENRALALASLEELKLAGYRVLEEQLVREAFADVPVTEAVVRTGDQLVLLRWKPFNRGWMARSECGWTIWTPAVRA